MVIGILLSGMTAAAGTPPITTDKNEYTEGEIVTITIINPFRSPIKYSGYWVESMKGEVVYNSPVLCEITMNPGERISESWAQICDDGSYVRPGAYAVRVESGSASITVLSTEGQVFTDKDYYFAGEVVAITISNVGETPIVLNGYWVEDGDGTVVYAESTLGFVQYLQPGEGREYWWSQVDDCGEQVACGEYEVCTEWDDAVIEIVEYAVVVATSQAIYAEGEEVVITVTNEGDAAVTIQSGFSVTDETGETIYISNALTFNPILQPGQSIQYVWEQTDANGDMVGAGQYTINAANGEATVTISEGDCANAFEPLEAKKPSRSAGERPHLPFLVPRPYI